MKKLLISGFEPFGGEGVNPSWETVARLPDEINGYSVIKLRVPVCFGEAADMIISLAEEVRPDVIISVGQAGGRDAVCCELVGINLRDASIPDNGGRRPMDEPIVQGGAAAYFSTLPVRKMVNAIKAAGINARISYSAGAYVCNDVFYTLLSHFAESSTRVGFIHIPYSEQQNKEPYMDTETVKKALSVAIENI